MAQADKIKIIARISSVFSEKFGIPRQSGLAGNISRIIFEEEFRNPDALRGIEGYSHLWLIWKFSESERETWSPTVRPPRLGGNERMGVFATRSPFRPNPLGLSSVELVGVEKTDMGHTLLVKGADLLDGTPIYDIKPYLAFTDSHDDAVGGFSDAKLSYSLKVDFPKELEALFCPADAAVIHELLAQDPRPAYIDDAERIFGLAFGGRQIKFIVFGDTLTVIAVE
ncbi:MAG: tRNA (N6-threonylcarbamoyladenosine(37)-N6)-methyltransferase TrmO [Ruminococcaceae bacterium]|nr:tRNA (N6-threonylcarbamoyladenosine(37)-N6)-methyltransferase TrmO [Oscillospiraceae bacterium]